MMTKPSGNAQAPIDRCRVRRSSGSKRQGGGSCLCAARPGLGGHRPDNAGWRRVAVNNAFFRRLDDQVKIIAMTGGGRGRRAYLSMGWQLGADYTIEKTFSVKEFLVYSSYGNQNSSGVRLEGGRVIRDA